MWLRLINVFIILLLLIGCKKEEVISEELTGAINFLNAKLSKEDIESFKKEPEDDIIGIYHMGLGRFIRNELGLWGRSDLKLFFENNDVYHPDQQSSVILIAYHRYLNNIAINEEALLNPKPTEEEIKRQKEYDDSIKKYNKWLSKWDLKLMQPFYTLKDSVFYDCSRKPYSIIKNDGHLYEYLRRGSRIKYTTTEFEKLADEKKLKKHNFIDYQSALWDDDFVHIYTTETVKYKKVNDTLYSEEKFYKISNDSINKLEKKGLNTIIEKNVVTEYIPVFSKSFFSKNNSVYTDDKQQKGFKLILQDFWKTKSGYFYGVYIIANRDENNYNEYYIIVDENLNIVTSNCDIIRENNLTWSTAEKGLKQYP